MTVLDYIRVVAIGFAVAATWTAVHAMRAYLARKRYRNEAGLTAFNMAVGVLVNHIMLAIIRLVATMIFCSLSLVLRWGDDLDWKFVASATIIFLDYLSVRGILNFQKMMTESEVPRQ